MSGDSTLGLISIAVTLCLGVLVFITNRRANRTNEKHLTVEEELAKETVDDGIADRRLTEIRRLDKLVTSLREDVDRLSKIVAELQKRDREKQTTIDDQADELERTNEILADVRELFSRYTARVEQAWKDGHVMPTLTAEERELLEKTIPHRTRNKENK